jgi:hypothetical protein
MHSGRRVWLKTVEIVEAKISGRFLVMINAAKL